MARLQFTLRALLILMAVIAAPLGWWSSRVRPQQVAVGYLEKRNSTIFFNDPTVRHGPETPLFLNWRYRVQGVILYAGMSVSDLETLKVLNGLNELEVVSLCGGTKAEALRLRAALPKCKVQYSTPPDYFSASIPPSQ